MIVNHCLRSGDPECSIANEITKYVVLTSFLFYSALLSDCPSIILWIDVVTDIDTGKCTEKSENNAYRNVGLYFWDPVPFNGELEHS